MAALATAFVVEECIKGFFLLMGDIKWVFHKIYGAISVLRSAVTRAFSSLVIKFLPRRTGFSASKIQKNRCIDDVVVVSFEYA